MAQFRCMAGHFFSDAVSWRIISDARQADAVDKIVALARRSDLSDDDLHSNIHWCIATHSFPGVTCPECGRMLVYENDFDHPGKSYKPE